NRPYGLAWRDDHVLVADQDGIWQVPHQIGALRRSRSHPQRADQVPPEKRGPVPGAYGAQLITRKGVFGIVQGHQNRHLAIDPNTGALFVGVGSSGNIGVERPSSASTLMGPTRQRSPPARAIQRRSRPSPNQRALGRRAGA